MAVRTDRNRRATPDSELDRIDEIRAQWAREAPHLDTTAVAILGRVTRVSSIAGREITRVFAAHDLERGEFDVLATLFRAGQPYELTPTELYRQLLISSGGLTHRLNCLEKVGLIARVQSNDDKRSSGVRLSKLGRERVVSAYQDDLALEEHLLGGLDSTERATLEKLLRKLHMAVELNVETIPTAPASAKVRASLSRKAPVARR